MTIATRFLKRLPQTSAPVITVNESDVKLAVWGDCVSHLRALWTFLWAKHEQSMESRCKIHDHVGYISNLYSAESAPDIWFSHRWTKRTFCQGRPSRIEDIETYIAWV